MESQLLKLSDVVTLNVGGQTFQTKKSTLKDAHYFDDKLVDEEVLFVDRSSKMFHHVLEYLRDNSYSFPKGLDLFKKELDFYKIKYEENKFKTNKLRENPKDTNDMIITLNIGGRVFQTKKEVLM